MAIAPETLLDALQWRYATKVFDPEQRIPADLWSTLEQTLVLTPSSYGLQPWKFLVIQDPALRQELRPHSWNQPQITDCSHLVVLLSQRSIGAADAERLIQATAAARSIEASSLDGYRNMIQIDLIDGPRHQIIERWSSNQVYIALGNLMTAAALLSIDTCAIEGFSPPDYDRILNLEDSDYRSCVVCACGYRSADDKYASLAKVRYAASELIEHR
ncbi:MAG: NAD(P)H-dependent oxidoreductase [Synechococcaceae cyanobacterium ELA739]